MPRLVAPLAARARGAGNRGSDRGTRPRAFSRGRIPFDVPPLSRHARAPAERARRPELAPLQRGRLTFSADSRLSATALTSTALASAFLAAAFAWHLRALLARFRKTDGDRLLAALHLPALSTGAAAQRPALFAT